MATATKRRSQLREYFAELERLPRLTHEETVELIILAQGGCLISRNRVVECNLLLVAKIVGRYTDIAELEDLVAEGNLGLFDAIRDFDRKQGVTFGTYAGWKVYNKVKKMLSLPPYTGVVRLPTYVAEAAKSDVPDPSVNLELNQLKALLSGEIAMGLTERERLVLRMIFAQGLTLRSCSAIMDVSKERIRQIKERALLRLHKMMNGRSKVTRADSKNS